MVLAVGVAAVDHPAVAHEHAVEVGSQDRLGVLESAARADGVDGRCRGDAGPQPVADAADAPTGLIDRDHGRVAYLLAQRLVGRPRVAGRTMQQMHEASRRHLQAEAGLQQVGDLGQGQAAARVQVDDQRDHAGAELCAGRPQRVGGLQRVATLDTPPTLRAVADLDVEAAHQWAHRGQVFLILLRRTGHVDRAAAVRTPHRHRRRQGLVDVRRARPAPLPAIARTGPPAGTFAATLRPLLGEGCGLPASRAALGRQLLFQVLVLVLQPLDPTLQAVVLTLHATVLAVHVFVARQFVTQSRDLSVLLLDDNVPRILLRRTLVQNGADAAQQAHAPFLSARRTKTFTPTRGFPAGDPVNEDARTEHVGRVFFWFGQRGFDQSWFNARLREALDSAGPRYTPPVHVDLPIAKDLECFGRTASSIDAVKAQAIPLRKAFQMLHSADSDQDDPSRNVPTEDLRHSVNAALEGFAALTPDPTGELPLQTISEHIREAESAATNYDETLSQHAQEYDVQHPDTSRWRSRQNPYDERIRQVYRLRSELRAAWAATDRAAEFANTHLMVLTGEAGTGKTHLLCDTARRRVGKGAPTVLLMGQRFRSPEAPWTQALQHLDLPGITAEQFVGALEAAAQAANCRALLIIDALNEGEGRAVWPAHLASFLVPLAASPWIAVLLSVRSTYADVIVPEEVHRKATAAVHHGFVHHEYDAARIFFSHYGLELPSTPILQPEFRNPLFLKTICQGLRDNGQQRLPRGLHGISAAIELYLRTINRRLAADLGYNPHDAIVHKALRSLAQLVLTHRKRWLSRAEASALVDDLLPGREYERSLYRGLVSEGLLVEDMPRLNKDDDEESVFISYERYADHAIADLLLSTHLDAESPGSAFAEGGGLAFLGDSPTHISRGLIEALCIQIPESTATELFELAPALADRRGAADSFRQSLVWRRLDAFSDATLNVLNRLLASRHDQDDTLETLLTVASLADHPYNADFLDRQLRRRTMPDRDAWWSIYVHRAWGTNGAVDRIVHWASDVTPDTDLSDRADELCSIVLAWMLTTSNRFLRDRATKSLVSLLTDRLTTARLLLERFAEVDDPYVAERVYAAVYGVVMRSGDRREVGRNRVDGIQTRIRGWGAAGARTAQGLRPRHHRASPLPWCRHRYRPGG